MAVSLPMSRRVEIVARADDGRAGSIVTKKIGTEITTRGVKSRANVGPSDYALRIIRQNLEGHGVPNVFSDTNPTSTFLLRVGWKVGIILAVVDWFIPSEIEERTDVWSRSGKRLKGRDSFRAGVSDVIQQEDHIS
jgi:hypothetical protein